MTERVSPRRHNLASKARTHAARQNWRQAAGY